MARNDTLEDKGTVYSKTGSSLTTSYTFGDAVSAGQATRFTLFVAAFEKASGSSMGNVTVKAQVRDAGGNWHDILTTRNNGAATTSTGSTGAGDTLVEHVLATTAGATTLMCLQTENLAPAVHGFRVAGKADGATADTDSLTVYAVVM